MLDCASATFVHNASIAAVNPREYDKYPGLSTSLTASGHYTTDGWALKDWREISQQTAT
jgi:hypothetical protein